METCSKYANNKCLILILWLKFLNEPNIFQLLFSKMLSRVKPIVNHSLSMTLRREDSWAIQAIAAFGFWVMGDLPSL